MQRYWKGWRSALRVYRMARAKRHGAGPTTIINAMKLAAWDRFIVDGQHCRPMRPPLFIRWSRTWTIKQRKDNA